MLSVKKLDFIPKKIKKRFKLILYLFFIFIFITIYFNVPKILNFSFESIKENLKKNNNININKITEVTYKIFPTPRLILQNSDFIIGDGIIDIRNSDLEIILRASQILNFKEINYKRVSINKGFLKINLNNINQLLSNIDKNKKKIVFRKNNIFFLQKDKFLFEVSNATIKIKNLNEFLSLNIQGNFLNNRIFINLESRLKNKYNLMIKMPELDIITKVFFKKNNQNNISGSFNLEILDHFLKFSFIKKDKVELMKGFVRSKLFNSSLEGELTFKPNFFSSLNFKPSSLNMEKLFPLIQKIYFSENITNLSLIKKINGNFNFKSKFEGRITNSNGELLFEDFKVGKNKSIFFNAKISEFGKKGKIKFNLVKDKKNVSKKIQIVGFLIPSTSKVIFESFFLNGTKISSKKNKEFNNKFEDELIQGSLENIFNERKLNKFFDNLL